MAGFSSYMICTAPRSGSTLLCRLLAATGIAGKPESYFYDPTLDGCLKDLGVSPASDRAGSITAMFMAAKAEGRGDSAIFGLRQQCRSLAFLSGALADLHPALPGDAARFQAVFGPTLFIHLTRADKLAQAVSWVLAEQRGLWHVAPDGTELERTAPPQVPVYGAALLRDRVATLTAWDRDWNDWFAAEAVSPLRLTYDGLSADPGGTLARVLVALGLDPAAARGVTPVVRRLSDATNADWVARLRAEPG